MQNASRKLERVISHPEAKVHGDFHSTIIPKSFCLGGLKINVQFDPTYIEKHNCIGQANYVAQEIVIDPSSTPLQTTEQAYLHEMVHWIFYMMGENELRNNERIVDLFAHFLYQALASADPLPDVCALKEESREVEFCGPLRPPVRLGESLPNQNAHNYKDAPLFGQSKPCFIHIPWWTTYENVSQEHFREDEDYSGIREDSRFYED